MYKHLFKRQKPCQAEEHNIELTDEIKNQILENRIYHMPQPKTFATNFIQNQQVINYIASIDAIEKLTKYTDYKKIELLTFDQTIEDKFMAKAKRLENDEYRYGFELTKDDLFDVIDQVSNAYRFKTFQDLNIYYDTKVNKLKIFDGEWEEMLTNRGIRKIIEAIQSHYWNEYECYLLKKIYTPGDVYRAQKFREQIEEYYRFIGSFDIDPYCRNRANSNILGNNDDTQYEIGEEWYGKYVKIRDNTKKSDLSDNKKNVLDIIRKNSAKNIEELNKKVFELFACDEIFQEMISNQ